MHGILAFNSQDNEKSMKNFKQDLQFTKMSIVSLWKMNWRKPSKDVERDCYADWTKT